MIKLLLVEDDDNFGFIIKNELEAVIGGYDVQWATNGEDALAIISKTTLDLIVSDIEMPYMDGFEMVKCIRAQNIQIPVIFMSVRTLSKDVVAGYDAGADMYIKKPFEAEELDAHIKTLIKNAQKQYDKTKETIYKLGEYTFYPHNHSVEHQSTRKQLGPIESKVLTLLCENMGKAVNRKDILDSCWPASADYKYTSRSLDVLISALRKKFSKDNSVSISAIKKLGLMFEVRK